MKLSGLVSLAITFSSALAYKVHNVTIGQDGLTFTPDSLTAAKGDYVTFYFDFATHGVAQAGFNTPCTPLQDATGEVGFFSGLIAATVSDTPTFTILVNSSDPIWFYCPEAYHCQSGMVGVINPPKNQTVDDWADASTHASVNKSPSEITGNITVGATSSLSSSSLSTTIQSSKTAATFAASSTATTAATATHSGAASTKQISHSFIIAGVAFGGYMMLL
ncbi:hypothetical protein V1514DRAFT_337368 [Lipomyces japonicus]|uniref:uncharacterized protein n=1 Tax=Lipomyces japonicus TaxID=56871 RepID=UPI0034CEBE88